MPNKRLKNALNAGKLIKRGFNLNKQKPQDLHLLYTVDCRNDRVEFAQDDDDENMAEIESRTKSRLFQIGSDSSDESEVADRNSNLTPSKSARIDSDVSLTDEKVEILCLQFNQNLNLLATGDSDGLVAIYDIFSGSSVRKKPNTNPQNSTLKKFFPGTKKSKKGVAASLSNNNMPTVCLKWHPYSNFSMNFLYYANVNGYIGVMDTETLEQRVLIEEQDEIACIDFSIDGSCLASVGKDAVVKLYDSNLNSNSSTLSKLIVSYGADSSSTSATPRSLMSARNDRFDSNRRLLLLDNDDPMNNDSISPSSHTNRLQAVKFSNTSSNILFTGGWDRSVKIWDRRTQRGYVDSLNGPFICGSDAIDVNDNQVLTASWVKENALKLWDIRNCSKSVSTLSISTSQERKKTWSNDDNDDDNDVSISTSKQKRGDNKGDTSTKSQSGEYLYGCKFFSSCNQSFDCDEEVVTANSPRKDSGGKLVNKLNYSTVLACGSGTQSLHLVDYEQASSGRHLAAVDCQSPLYCLDAIYSCSLIACGGMKKFFMMMSSSHDLQFQ